MKVESYFEINFLQTLNVKILNDYENLHVYMLTRRITRVSKISTYVLGYLSDKKECIRLFSIFVITRGYR